MESQSEKDSLHERFESKEELKIGSDRGFGLTVGGILAAIAAYRTYAAEGLDTAAIVLLALGCPLALLGLALPGILAPLNRAWTRFGLILFKVVNPLVMGLIFVLTVMPIGLVLRLLGQDPLRLKMIPDANSYWIERSPPGPAPESMKKQF